MFRFGQDYRSIFKQTSPLHLLFLGETQFQRHRLPEMFSNRNIFFNNFYLHGKYFCHFNQNELFQCLDLVRITDLSLNKLLPCIYYSSEKHNFNGIVFLKCFPIGIYSLIIFICMGNISAILIKMSSFNVQIWLEIVFVSRNTNLSLNKLLPCIYYSSQKHNFNGIVFATTFYLRKHR